MAEREVKVGLISIKKIFKVLFMFSFMKTELEATFPNINKEDIRKKLKNSGAKLLRPEFMQKRYAFRLPKGYQIAGSWARVRDEGNKITMSVKIVDGDKIENQKEVCLEVDDFNEAVSFLTLLGCEKKAYQETKRELWKLGDVEITIDEWPFLEPFLEVEGDSEKAVIDVINKIGLNYEDALFCAVDKLYNLKYNVSQDIINNHTPEIVFNGKNPFSKK